jgi:hypothetical protein
MRSSPFIEVTEPWEEVSLSSISGRTQMGKIAKLGLVHGWVVKVARTLSKSHEWERKNGNIVQEKVEEHFWVGGARPNFQAPEKGFLINKHYMKIHSEFFSESCDFDALQNFILKN